MHQPLHLTGRERGGNGVKVRFGDNDTNLHAAWDTFIPNKLVAAVPEHYARPLPDFSFKSGRYTPPSSSRIVLEGGGVYPSPPARAILKSTPGVYALPTTPFRPTARPIHALNCEYAWPAEVALANGETDPPDLDVPSYMVPIQSEMAIEKLLTQGGLRLAGIFNWFFAQSDE
ncbi:hypothetical protein CC1G_15710 [Coprinopsis cinerea okayama7|uniref:Uncharacterized protein n=1 Tax=Coprinopsis cinerea (strain Okayama-7 / 130 / ATCC MYA-4618 / FGSC 9003) TaxID=240176 RepID=D6RQH1_COPC7|nr:hypothetical protein CC1G_15710 [Coprinopsis cinerea okayama7\|eukprot:XP_002910281.1 hypothetical protein CC1G_15710 [Coprinopsis cinerea okayama7\